MGYCVTVARVTYSHHLISGCFLVPRPTQLPVSSGVDSGLPNPTCRYSALQVVPFLYKLHKGELLEKEQDIQAAKNAVLK